MHKFHFGQIIEHQVFGYRGVIIGVDACFEGNEQLFNSLPLQLPDKSQPWYYVLVDHKDFYTYVAEQNLQKTPHSTSRASTPWSIFNAYDGTAYCTLQQ